VIRARYTLPNSLPGFENAFRFCVGKNEVDRSCARVNIEASLARMHISLDMHGYFRNVNRKEVTSYDRATDAWPSLLGDLVKHR
jgi:hypothetical protein